MKKALVLVCLALLTGCSSVQIPDYIRGDRGYIRKIGGEYSSIVASVKQVLWKEGYRIRDEVNPADYERRDGEDQSADILIFTEPKKHSKVAYTTYTHLNVLVHATAEGAEVEIRYEAVSPGAITRSTLRNDKLVYKLLDEIEKSVESI